jgi:hypothetical protein
MSIEIRPASRQHARLLIGLYGESGSGKTKSALLLARGIAGPDGKIVVIDTEAGRAEFFADEIPGGYDVLPLSAPFSPSRYAEAITACEETGAKVICLDSASHSWEGQGGVLDMAGENENAGKKGLAVWKNPKMEHAKFVLKLMQSNCTVIVCLRAKFKSRQVKNAKGFTEIVKDEHLTPIQAEDFLFELTTHMQVNPDHTIYVTKEGRADLRACLPENDKEPIKIAHGEAIAQWAANPGKISGPQTAATSKPDDTKALKAALWNMAKSKYATAQEFEQMLWDEGIIDTERESLSELSSERLIKVTADVRKKLNL